MRIGIDCRMFQSSFTGIGRYTFELVKTLQRLSAQAQTKAQSQSELAAKNEYILFLNEPEFSSFTPSEPNFKKVLVDAPHYSLKEQTKFLKILNFENLDLMHFTHFNAPIRYKKPFITTIHDLTHNLFPGRKMKSFPYRLAYKAVIKNAVKKAARVIAVSNNTKNDLIKILKVPEEKIEVIYEGTNEEFHLFSDTEREKFTEILKDKYGVTPPFLLYTGVHRYHKNLVRLIEAFKILKENHPLGSNHDLKLVITGRADPLYPEVEEEVTKQNLQDSVIFTGLVNEDELIALYNLANIYVFPSLYEGFGLPILEAFACGTPVVASNISSLPEVAGEGNAVFFNPYDPKDMADKIGKVLSDIKLAGDLIRKGSERLKFFSWEKMAEEILKVYNTFSQ